MKKTIISLAMIAAVGAIVVGATTAYFSDTETSTGNTFTAGSIDLKVDSTSHYNGMICTEEPTGTYTWESEGEETVSPNHYPQPGTTCDGTWAETDLGAEHKFFNYSDLKPGDEGEDTLSLHVYSNDAWGRMTITGLTDTGDYCTEPETEMSAEEDADCSGKISGAEEKDGELRENTLFSFWLDQGYTPGFQGKDDRGEGDNIWQPEYEPLLSGVIPMEYDGTIPVNPWWQDSSSPDYPGVSDGIIEIGDEVHDLWEALAIVRDNTPICVNTPENGQNDYGDCQGLAVDGRLVGSTTYYFGLGWQVPYTVGNEAQGDGFTGDVKFEVVQHRNNKNQTF